VYLGGKKSGSTSRASSVSAELPKSSGRSSARSSIDTSVTYNQRQTKTAAATAANMSTDGEKANGGGTATRSASGRGRHSTGVNREQIKPAATSTATVETVKRKISSEWDDCMWLLFCYVNRFYCVMIYG